jgi:tight adherence protein C
VSAALAFVSTAAPGSVAAPTAPAGLAFVSAALGVAALALLVPRRSSGARGSRGTALFRVLARAGGRVGRRFPRDLAQRIAAAGVPAGLGPRELMAAKLAAAVAAALMALLAASIAPGRLGALVLVAAPAAGFLAPDLWLLRRARARAWTARRELPALLDLLRVSVEAGGSLPAALEAVGNRAGGPVAAEWRAVGREVALGVPPARALEEMTRRLPLPELRALAAALERARRHGAPLAETLAAQARDARFALRRRLQEEGARAGPKMQLVVALLLVPSVLLLVAAALAAALIDGGTGLIAA